MAGIVRQDYEIFKIFETNPVILSKALQDGFADLFVLRGAKLVQLLPQLRATVGEYRDREKRRVYRTRLANRHRCHGDSARHLNRCEERIEAVEGVALH